MKDWFDAIDRMNGLLNSSEEFANIASLGALYNLERARSYLETHLGASQKEVAYALDLTPDQTKYIFKKLRAAWPK